MSLLSPGENTGGNTPSCIIKIEGLQDQVVQVCGADRCHHLVGVGREVSEGQVSVEELSEPSEPVPDSEDVKRLREGLAARNVQLAPR